MSAEPRRLRIGRDLVGPSVGTILEWYDFSVYIYLAPVIARLFFPSDDHIASLLATLGVFAVSYLARPLGAIAFGEFGDRLGRRATLIISAAMMAVPLVLIGLLPTHSEIGVAAPILLVVLRVVMGFSVGGEYTAVLVYLVEIAPRERRGFVASLAPITAGVGALLAIGVSTLVVGVLSRDELDSWGWRLPFLLGGLIALYALFARYRIHETPAFKHLRDTGRVVAHPSAVAVRRAGPTVRLAFALSALGSVSYFLGITYVPTYLDSIVGVGHETALAAATVASTVILGVMAVAGWAADRTGRRPMLIWVTVVLAVAPLPLFLLLSQGTVAAAYIGTIAFALPVGAFQAVAAVTIPEQFPTPYRFSGMAIGYNIAVALFGGLAPFLGTLLVEWTGDDVAPAFLLVVTAVVVLAVIVFAVAETARRPLRDAPLS